MISIGTNGFQLLINYAAAIIVCIVVALALKLPLVPEKPVRNSWTNSAIYPTPIIAIGIFSIFLVLLAINFVGSVFNCTFTLENLIRTPFYE